ncbi:MAG: class I SAM-dependent methyltransferase [Gammaproteobacteria bacterium]|nr:class I SAM-dependent methyltransferase [Gammaproteobacteria bacterium]NIR82418.1 class I SAM-dependent methyltransferase [Gammaproteobacteria bacterium]NIR91999.1 class I SAM-dependent methyltransferase [Gammaproteobacteria bacterium]NIU03555.1 class I SAM-dependent methyltransferase [Gammaproteobacteria bacterium]NIX84829.1 methyltransferase domain-containing protein [Gammaproteobacteria bacterium]
MGTLSHQEARRTYDRIGSWQDSQGFYEDRASALVLRYGDLASAASVFEFGCGTGRFALRLFEEYLPSMARYRGIDVSPEMVRLAQTRLASHSPRAEVLLTEGGPPIDEPAEAYDRFVSSYVFDLLSQEDIRLVLREAHRMLRPGGLLCLSGLSSGVGLASRTVAGVVSWLQSLCPSLVGGCRPVDLLPFLLEPEWQVKHHSKVVAFGIPSEVVVATRR